MKKLLLTTALFAVMSPVFAEQTEPQTIYLETPKLFGEVKENQVITLSSIPEDARTSGSAIEIVLREELEKQNNPHLTDVLNQLPGVTIQRSGSIGDVTSFRIRGLDRVRVNVDNVRADNPADGKFYLQNYNTEDIDRIEVLKGPQSSIIGSNGSGGTVNITTRRGRGPIKFTTDQEGGSFNTYKSHYSLEGGNEKIDYYLGIGHMSSDGGSRINDNLERVRHDGYRQFSLTQNIGLRLFKNKGELRNITRWNNAHKDVGINGWGTNIQQDPNDYSRQQDFQNVTSFDYDTGKMYSTRNQIGIFSSRYNFYQLPDDYDMSPGHDYIGSTRFSFNTLHNFRNKKKWNTFQIGYYLENQTFKTISDYSQNPWFPSHDDFKGSIFQNDVYIHDIINIKDKLFIRGGARMMANNQYGTYFLPDVSATFITPTPKMKGDYSKIKASYGMSANMPTLYQRFAHLNGMLDPNPSLTAEKINGWEVGVEQTFFNQKLTLSGSYFNSRYKDFIGYESDPITWVGRYVNIDNAKTSGFEGSAKYKLNDKLQLFANYTYTDAKDNQGVQLPGVPTHRINGGIAYTPFERLTLFTRVEHGSARTYSAGNTDTVDGYTDVAVGGILKLFQWKGLTLNLKAQVYNVLNQKQSMYKNYYQPGINFMVGGFLTWNIGK